MCTGFMCIWPEIDQQGFTSYTPSLNRRIISPEATNTNVNNIHQLTLYRIEILTSFVICTFLAGANKNIFLSNALEMETYRES